MKKLLITSIAVCCLFVATSSAQIRQRIGVDPGHGGTDSGAVGPTGFTEKQASLSTALSLKKYLEADGATVFITRTTDVSVSLTSRTNYFISNAVARAISVHHNCCGTSTNTTMDFVYCGRCFTNAGNLASSIIQRLGSSTGLPKGPAVSTSTVLCSGRSDWSCGRTGVGQANLHMVREPEIRASIPSTLVEVSFITNPSEEQRLRNPDYTDSNGWAIYAGLADHFGVVPKPRGSQQGDFSISTSPGSLSVTLGNSVSYTIFVRSSNGFSGSVDLFALNLPNNQVLPGTGFNPQRVFVAANGSTTSILTIVTNDFTPLGVFDITVKGVNGILTRFGSVRLLIYPRSADPLDQQAQQDMRNRAARDGRFGSERVGTFGKNLNWDPSWELRWVDFNFSGSRIVRLFHARSKSSGIRFTQFFDPDRGQWTNWEQSF